MNIKKLSTAILQGTKKTKRANGMLHDRNNQGFCALGAAAYAIGAVDCTEPPEIKNKKLREALHKRWGIILATTIKLADLPKKERILFRKQGQSETTSLHELIFTANDDLKWRRDRIGNFVKRLGF